MEPPLTAGLQTWLRQPAGLQTSSEGPGFGRAWRGQRMAAVTGSSSQSHSSWQETSGDRETLLTAQG